MPSPNDSRSSALPVLKGTPIRGMMAHFRRIPPDALLTRFLRDRQRPVPVDEVAALAGWSRDAVQRQSGGE